MKFKVGDQVIVVNGPGLLPSQIDQVGKTLTILSIDEYGPDLYEIYLDDYNAYYDADELEFPEVYNSPLYKAMKED